MAKTLGKSGKTKRSKSLPFYQNPRFHALFVALVALVMYGQTLRFDFVMDDKMVITDHKTVQQGFAGIPTLVTQDSFAGFDENYDRAGQRKTYRPVSFISFAIEKQLFGNNTVLAHGINIALYALTLLVLLALLRAVFVGEDAPNPPFRVYNFPPLFPLAVTLLFAVHPIHIAVVTNIKSRDEIFALLFVLLSLRFLLQYIRLETAQNLALSLVFFSLALLSKESAVLMLPVVCGFVYTVTNLDMKRFVTICAPFFVVTALFLAVWFGLVGRVEEGLYAYKLHNPFVGATFAERIATGMMTLGLYCLKAIFPITLSEGYTYNALPVVSWMDARVIAGFLATASLLIFGAIRFLRQDVIGFSILAFFAGLAIASNLVVYAGSMFGDRFLYTPSLFAVLGFVWLLFEAFGAVKNGGKNFRFAPVMGIILVVAMLYAVRGFMRLPDWKTDYALLQSDHRATPESMMTARNYASQLILRAGNTENDTERGILLDEADVVLARALATDSTADPAVYDLQSLSALQRGDFARAIALENRALTLDSATRLAIHRKPIFKRNLASAFVSRSAKSINEERFAEAVDDLKVALQLNPNNENAYINLGMIFGRQKEYKKALGAFQAAYKVNPGSKVAQQYIFHIQQALTEEEAEKPRTP
ncbi:MAG: hypothetical protein ACOVSW_08255 [Candidatus Kapaibacteriota bacterium]